MFSPQTPVRVQNAHKSIVHIHEFLAKYQRWIAAAGTNACDFALGNPQTMPLADLAEILPRSCGTASPRSMPWLITNANHDSLIGKVAKIYVNPVGRIAELARKQ